jgi:hypothetical protein
MTSATRNRRSTLIAASAQIPRNLLPGGRDWDMVQEAMGRITPSISNTELVISTVEDLSRTVYKLVVPNNGREPEWYIHAGHKARKPRTSPFIAVGHNWAKTSTLTIVTAGSKIVRVIPGEYEPPLPWQVSAGDEAGGRQTCLEYWRRHSYLMKPGVALGDPQPAPVWYSKWRRSR